MINTKKKKGITIAILAVIAALCLSFGLAALLGAFGGGLTESSLTVFAATGPVQTHEWWHTDEDAIDLNTYVTQNGTTLEGGASEKSAKHYCLSGDITLTENITIEAAEDGSDSYVELCLNGYMLKGNGQGSVITINEGGNLSLYDCPSGRTHPYTVSTTSPSTGLWTFGSGSTQLVGGVITGGAKTDLGGGVVVKDGGKFTMYSGTLAGNGGSSSPQAGGVWIMGAESEFTMVGGAIAGNTAGSAAGVGVANGGSFTMYNGTITQNRTITFGGGVCVLGYNKTTTTFNMYGGEISNNAAVSSAGGVYLLYFKSVFNMYGGKISGNQLSGNSTAVNAMYGGGGVFVGNGNQNECVAEEGEESEFNMYGGEISGNSTGAVGGGVFIGNNDIFTMGDEIPSDVVLPEGFVKTTPTIKGNTAKQGGGVYIYNATFNMKGGVIGGVAAADANNATGQGVVGQGGGVYANDSEMNMTDGKITGNTAYAGGGVYSIGAGTTFTMSGGEISNNTANNPSSDQQGSGGGVSINAIFIMQEGEKEVDGKTVKTIPVITGNTSQYDGSAVLIASANDSKFIMTGGIITGNTQQNSRNTNGAVSIYSLVGSGEVMAVGKMQISGNPQIYGNTFNGTPQNVSIGKNGIIEVTGALEEGAKIGVTRATGINGFGNGVVTKNYETYNEGVNPDNFFFSDLATLGSAKLVNGEVDFDTTPSHRHDGVAFGTQLTTSITEINAENIAEGGKYYLANNLTLTSTLKITGNGWTAPEGDEDWERVEVTLCLGGYTLSSNAANAVIEVTNGAHLTICDCRDTGTITRSANNGTIIKVDNAELTLESGTITKGTGMTVNVNHKSSETASVAKASLNVGGGVLVENGSKFTMTGGSIKSNTAVAYGGGVFVNEGSEFVMKSGLIAGNSVSSNTFFYGGGGVCVSGEGAKFTMEDGNISSNTSAHAAGGVLATYGSVFDMYGGTIGGTATVKNTALYGGGARLQHATANIYGGVISGNSGTDTAGALYIHCSVANMYGGTFAGNTSPKGAGVWMRIHSGYISTFNMYGGTIANNTGAANGGGVYVEYENCTFNMGLDIPKDTELPEGFVKTAPVISGHSVTGNGGGVYMQGGTFNMSGDAKIERNSATSTSSNGGGVYAAAGTTFTMSDNAAVNFNMSAYRGGGVWAAGTFTMNGGSVSYNSSKDHGGVVVTSGTFTMNGGSISYNATNYSGGLLMNGGTFTMNGGEISYNTATDHTGGVYLSGASNTFNMWDGKIIGNASGARGGGIMVDLNSTLNLYGGEISRNSVGSTEGVIGSTSGTGTYIVNGGGGSIYVHGTLNMMGGVIKENSAYIGGGIVVAKCRNADQATANIYGGEIVNNFAKGDTSSRFGGGGIAAFNAGTLNLGGGASVSNNTMASGTGGGVYVNSSTFNMYGGTVSHNTVLGGGWAGGVFTFTGVFNMYGGSISYNTATAERGGGVYGFSDSTLNLMGGEISYNTTYRHSSGVGAENSTLTLSGTVISHNIAQTESGAVSIFYSRAVFNMTGGVIAYNEGANGGSGVTVGVNAGTNAPQVNITGGVITGNKAHGSGGGVRLQNTIDTLTLGGSAQIYGNYVVPAEAESAADYKQSDVYLFANQNITVSSTAPLTSGAKIGVRFADAEPARTGTFATGYNTTSSGAEASKYFYLNDGRSVTTNGTNVQVGSEVEHNHNGYEGTPISVNKPVSPDDGDTAGADDDSTYYLGENGYVLTSGKYYLTGDITQSVTISGEVELCLNGYKITAENGSVITVERNGKLTLHDCQGSGAIMGGTGTLVGETTRGGGIYVSAGSELIMDSGVIQFNKADLGGAIYAAQGSTVELSGTATVSASEATLGGAIYVSGSVLTIKDDAKILSSSAKDGGGVYLDSGLVSLQGGLISANTAQNGGGIYAKEGIVLLSGGSLYGNAAEETEDENGDKIGGNGAALYMESGVTVTMTGSELYGNVAKRGAVYVNGGTFDMKGGKAHRNNASQGAVVYVADGKFNLTGGSLVNNNAYEGGAIFVAGGEANIYTTVGGSGAEANTAVYGGGVAVSGGTLNIEDGGVISYNTAYLGGGGAYVNGGSLYLKDGAVIAFNTAKIGDTLQNGGGVYMDGGTLYVLGGTISNNTATLGGGVYINGGTLDMSAGTIADHSGALYGGGVYIESGEMLLSDDGVIRNNTATASGGGVYMDVGAFNMNGGEVKANGTETTTFGGGLYVAGGEFNMDGGVFSENEAIRGAAMYVFGHGTMFTMTNGVITNNTASSNGGGVYLFHSSMRMSGGSITGNTAVLHSGGVQVEQGAILDMTGGEISGNTATNGGGGGVHIAGTDAGKYSTFNMYGGTIENNTAGTYGGGVSVFEGASFNMYGGTIENNTATTNGGGVYMPRGTLNFYGGEIKNNTATESGGGVYLQNAEATFNFYGGEISGNRAQSGGGGVYAAVGTFTMGDEIPEDVELPEGFKLSAPVISGNKSIGGGGVYVNSGTFTMKSGEISGNMVTTADNSSGGGVYVFRATFNMDGGVIKNNVANCNGGGVFVQVNHNSIKAYFTMTGGEISGNSAQNGGGVHVIDSGCTFNMTGGSITGNSADSLGGGIYVFNGTLNISGDVEISGNKANGAENNVHLNSGRIINVTGKLGPAESEEGEDDETVAPATHKIGVSMATAGTFTTNLNTAGEGNYQYFFSDSARYVVEAVSATDKNAKLATNTGAHIHGEGTADEIEFDTPLNAVGSALESGHYYLTQNITYTSFCKVSDGKEVYICLNGYTLQRGNTGSTSVSAFVVSGNDSTLVICDCGATGTITTNRSGTLGGGALQVDKGGHIILESGTVSNSGNASALGSGVLVNNGSTFTMNGGTISGGAASNGGGVYVGGDDSVFNMNGGTISTNTAGRGGGVYVESGTFNMNGGSITGNTATPGGGVYVTGANAKFTMNGGTISNNTATGTDNGGAGGGVNVISGAAFVMNGGVISNNQCTGSASPGGDGGGVSIHGTGTTFDMFGGSITQNKATANATLSAGGGVIAWTNATFNMYGGEISGNTATQGGSVLYCSGAAFNMYGGTISGNTTNGSGSVHFTSGGTFNMGGEIPEEVKLPEGFVKTVPTISGNTAQQGGGVYVASGTFTMESGLIDNNTATAGGGGGAAGGGGVKVTGGTFTMNGGTVSNNTANAAGADGGGVYVASGAIFNMSDGKITGNSASDAGGGVCIYDSTFTMTGGTISGNTAWDGGGMWFHGTSPTFTMSGTAEISGNTAKHNGGGVCIYDSTFTMTGGTISGNTATTYGGGVWFGGTTFTMSAGEISGNTAGEGGGVYVNAGEFTMSGGEISGNTATDRTSISSGGGGVYHNAGTFTMTGDAVISDNTSNYRGGGVFANATFKMDKDVNGKAPVISGNKASAGGAVALQNGTIDMNAGEISGNEANYGGAIYLWTGTFNLNGGSIIDNRSFVHGGALAVYRATLNMSDGIISGNSAAYLGGGVYAYDEPSGVGAFNFAMTGGTISGNTAGTFGGGVCVTQYYNASSTATFSVSSKAKIYENTVNGLEQNVYLGKGKTMAVGALNEGAKIGITLAANYGTGAFTSSVANVNVANNQLFSDDGTQCIWQTGNNLYIKAHELRDEREILTNLTDEHYHYYTDGCANPLDSDPVRESHIWGEWITTNIKIGEQTHQCDVCGKQEKRTLEFDGIIASAETVYEANETLKDVVVKYVFIADDGTHETVQLESAEYRVIYPNGNELHWGDTSVIIEHVRNGVTYSVTINDLVVGRTVLSITATPKSNDPILFTRTLTLDDLKAYITVMATFNDGPNAELSADEYTIDGTLGIGARTFTITSLNGNKTATVTLNIVDEEETAEERDRVHGSIQDAIDEALKKIDESRMTPAQKQEAKKQIEDAGKKWQDALDEEQDPENFDSYLDGFKEEVKPVVDESEARTEAKKKIDEELKKALEDLKNLTDPEMRPEDLERAEKELTEAANKAKDAIDELPLGTDPYEEPTAFDNIVENFENERDELVEDAKARSDYKNRMDDAADEAKKAVDGKNLTDEQKEAVKKRIDDIRKDAQGEIDAESDREEFPGIYEDYLERLKGLLEDENLEEKADFWNDLEEHAKAKKEYVDSREDLPPEEKERRKNAIDEELKKGNEAIENAESVEEAQKELDDAKLIISRIADENYDKKEEAKDEIDQAAQDKKDEIDGRDDLLPGDKEAAKKAVDEEAAKAKDNIDKAITPEGVQKALDDGLAAIERAGTPAKPHEIGGMIVIIAIETLTILGLGTAGIIIKKKKGL